MPEPVSSGTLSPSLRDCALGFYGKIPARGDFVRNGLPHAFVDPWDRWLQQGIAASQAELGDEWVAAWLEAPIWSFALAPGVCGPDAVLGLWMPSVDRVGRHFPLTLAAIAPAVAEDVRELVRDHGGFLAAAEHAGLAAVESDLGPEELTERILATTAALPADPGVDPAAYPGGNALWWTEGSPRVPRCAFTSDTLPDDSTFTKMLDAGVAAIPAEGAGCL
jgi:type VI secretion system protein ImpM